MKTFCRVNLYRDSEKIGSLSFNKNEEPNIALLGDRTSVAVAGQVVDTLELEPVDAGFHHDQWTVEARVGTENKRVVAPIPSKGSKPRSLEFRHGGASGWKVLVRSKARISGSLRSQTIYAQTYLYDGATTIAKIFHTSASSIPTISLTSDSTDVKYNGTPITTAVFDPLDPGLTATTHGFDIVGTCGQSIREDIPESNESDTSVTYECTQAGSAWTLKVETKKKESSN